MNELPEPPKPDTHCWDDDERVDEWSHSAYQLNQYGAECYRKGLENAAGRLSADDLEILESVRREMDEGDGVNAPGHGHSRPGIWDDDNKPEKAGKPCAWCMTWQKFTALIRSNEQAIRGML